LTDKYRQDKNKINILLCLTETRNYIFFCGLVAIYHPVGVTGYLHLHDIRESVEFSEAEGKFAKLALSHTVSGPLTL